MFIRFTLLLLLVSTAAVAQQPLPFPDFGKVRPIPNAVSVLDKSRTYKVVYDIKEGAPNLKEELNYGIEKVARMYNYMALEGVPPEQIKAVVILYSEASLSTLDDAGFAQHHGVKANPSTRLINELAAKGVEFYVCGQSIQARKLTDYKLNPHVKVLTAASLGFLHFQNLGYTLMKVDSKP